MKFNDLTNKTFGRLTAKTVLPSLRPGDGFRWVCICECGKECVVKTRLLTYKFGTRSCGCLLMDANRARPNRNSTNLKHGHSSRGVSPEYISWSSMVQRCTNPKHESYKNYGAKGICVCPEWATSFERFFSDMGPRPDRTSIDRIDGSIGYFNGNCRWATMTEQANNRRGNVSITVFGKPARCKDVAAMFGVPERSLYRWAKMFDGEVGLRATEYQAAKRLALI